MDKMVKVWYQRKAVGEQGIENKSPKAMSNTLTIA